ncbi:hypothetical protein AAV99_01305 [Aurantiacibacter marinus]|uniref:Uncharacterized protein n=2 Tax=Aurantiacibacter marinus TaxID=874156 RepID=A0A0H0XR74_9SPHN|nr:hypothetical protein AAV99_01305 [Aurantiacibacter marinus]
MGGPAVSESKSFASLGPMLLARKGTAKPAMRLQIEQSDRVASINDDFDDLASSQNALGWNDMGDTDDVGSNDDDVISLPVTRKAPTQKKPAALTKIKAASKAVKATAEQKTRAAFTLRLDAERHLKLRLASTLQGSSAQALVTEALDSFLEEIPELGAIAARMRRMNHKS